MQESMGITASELYQAYLHRIKLGKPSTPSLLSAWGWPCAQLYSGTVHRSYTPLLRAFVTTHACESCRWLLDFGTASQMG